MKINRFKFENKNLELIIESICFSNPSLLVGGSGVGKSLILQSLSDLKEIAQGFSLDGVEWEIQFSIESGKECLWKGAFEKTGIPEIYEAVETTARITYENLLLDGYLVVERKENEIKLQGESTPKLSSYQSALHLFNEEEIIFPIANSLKKIIQSNDDPIRGFRFIPHFNKFLQKYNTLERIQNASISIYDKLALAYKNKLEIFDAIRDSFINVFTQVEDIKLEPIDPVLDSFDLQIKEKNVSKWVFHNRISSGMFKTLMQISQLFLCAEGSVILIDEFENSLGINCIDALTDNLLDGTRDLQFILTSHHPYIINAIGMEHWKVVSRTGGVISAKDATDYKLGKSRHEAFKQLIQLSDYRNGINI
jgi:predicted ATPase